MKSKEELKLYSIQVLKELKPFLEEVEQCARDLHDNPDRSDHLRIESQLVGVYTFITPKFKEFEAKSDSCEAIYYNNLKVKSEIDSTKFVSEVATRAAKEYVEDVRVMASVLEGWVKSIEQLLTTCRNRSYQDRREQKHV